VSHFDCYFLDLLNAAELVIYDNEEVEITIREWLRISEHDLNGNGIFKILPLWKKCMKCEGGDVAQR